MGVFLSDVINEKLSFLNCCFWNEKRVWELKAEK